jgi:tryptophanyl-tRNA synthetase
MREAYQDLMNNPARIEAALVIGAEKARKIATPFMAQIRHSVGLRSLTAMASTDKAKVIKTASASFKQYREKDGKFYFKLVDAKGETLVQSLGFESPKVAGQHIALLRDGGLTALHAMQNVLETVPTSSQVTVAAALTALSS